MTRVKNFKPENYRSKASQDKVREIIFLIRKLIHGEKLYTKELNIKYSITAAQLNCLLALHENGPLPPSQIAKHMMVNSSTVTGVIDRLEQKGLVVRKRNSSDRRIINVELTPDGQNMAQSAPPPIQQRVVDGLQKLSSEELDQIVHSLAKLTRMLDFQDLGVQ
jgi:DNA-binding MarR family transcriptional regulator